MEQDCPFILSNKTADLSEGCHPIKESKEKNVGEKEKELKWVVEMGVGVNKEERERNRESVASQPK